MTLPAYPEYKDSGVEWLGEVPSHWRTTPLFCVASECDESNKGMIQDNLLSLSYGNITRKDINSNDGLLPESFETYQIIHQGDIVLRLTDLQNDQKSLRSALVNEVGIITAAYTAIRPIQINSDYLALLLRAYDVQKIFYSMGGGLRQSMKFSDLRRLPILLPPEKEQSAIATFLDRETGKIDGLIAEQKKLIDLLSEKRQGVISHAVTKGLDPTAPMKDSGVEWLGEVPAHWAAQKLTHLATAIGDGLHGTPIYDDDGPNYFINGNNLCGGEIVLADTTRRISQEEANRHAVPLNDRTLLMSINGTIGNLAYYKGEPITLGKSAAYIRCDHFLSLNFLYWFLCSSQVARYFDLELTGTTISNLSLESIRNLRVILPPKEEQEVIAVSLDNHATKFNSLIAEAQSAIGLLRERRSALISAAVTGKIDVRGLVEANPPEAA